MNFKKVVTNRFELEEKVYFKILIRTRLKDHWWFYALLLSVIMWNIQEFGTRPFPTYMVILCLIYPFFSFFYLYFWATSPKNRAVFLKRNLEFDNNYMTIHVSDGTENRIPFKKIVKCIETRTFYLLYIAKAQFIYIPKNSFQSDKDLETFHEMVTHTLENPQ